MDYERLLNHPDRTELMIDAFTFEAGENMAEQANQTNYRFWMSVFEFGDLVEQAKEQAKQLLGKT